MGEIQGRRDEIEIWTLFFRKRSLLSSCNQNEEGGKEESEIGMTERKIELDIYVFLVSTIR
jgi:hypothetical protein